MSCKNCQYAKVGFTPVSIRCGHPKTPGHDLPEGLATPAWCPLVPQPEDRIKALEDRVAALESRLAVQESTTMTLRNIGGVTP